MRRVLLQVARVEILTRLHEFEMTASEELIGKVDQEFTVKFE